MYISHRENTVYFIVWLLARERTMSLWPTFPPLLRSIMWWWKHYL